MAAILVFSVALLLTLLLTPLAKAVAIRFGILDRPGERKIHKKAIPLTGGEALFLSFGIALLLSGHFSKEMSGVIWFGLLFILFGFLDDAGIKIRARYKIWSHLLFSFLFIHFTGIHFSFIRTEWINWILTGGFITFMTNSMNMLDGMDGLDAGISFIEFI